MIALQLYSRTRVVNSALLFYDECASPALGRVKAFLASLAFLCEFRDFERTLTPQPSRQLRGRACRTRKQTLVGLYAQVCVLLASQKPEPGYCECDTRWLLSRRNAATISFGADYSTGEYRPIHTGENLDSSKLYRDL